MEEIFNCSIDDTVYFLYENFEDESFSFFHPKNWEAKTTKDKTHTTYLYDNIINELTDEELLTITDQEFYDRYYEFESFTITQDKIYKGFNYDLTLEHITDKIKRDEQKLVEEDGTASYNGKSIKWIKYIDETYKKDSLSNLSFATCLVGEENYLWIHACVFGKKNVENRMCKLVGVINTITIK